MPKILSFFPNEPDDRHCFQASYAMVLSSLLENKITMRQAELDTGYVKGLSTWAFHGMLSFADHGFTVWYTDDFDVEIYSSDPKSALIEAYGASIADRIEKRSDLSKLKSTLQRWKKHKNIVFEKRSPDIFDIEEQVSFGRYLIANVNYFKLVGKDGYNGHSVVIESTTDDSLIIQNPGLPPIKNQICKKNDFRDAWMYPDRKASNLISIGNR